VLYPTAPSVTITGNIAGPFINLNGADNVIIDGSVNRTAGAASLALSNTNTEVLLFSISTTQLQIQLDIVLFKGLLLLLVVE
jgi:hypothetical protein